ncbi:MAG: radical SAM protein [Roseburia sp.]
MNIKRLLVINVPIKNCNLKCEYCYISALNEVKKGPAIFKYSPEHVGRCLSQERLGGPCIINLTGGGETLIPKEMPQFIYHLLKQGHYLEVVTNGTITERFEEIATFPKEYLNRLEFKFSFHYKELKKKNWLERYFDNVKLMSSLGCSYTIELMPYDEIAQDIDDIISICEKEVGAACQITVGRNDLTGSKELLTNMSRDDYEKTWKIFDSNMFKFKLDIFGKKIKEFCYAGAWSLYIDLGTGAAKPCYGQLSNQNVFEDIDRPIVFEPVGTHCRQPYCYNGHAFLTMGMVPSIEAPCYADIRNRVTKTGDSWLKPEVKEAFSCKLYNSNEEWSDIKKLMWGCTYPLRFIKSAIYDRKEIYEKVIKRNKD